MSDFGSSLEQYGPMHELSGRASKADLMRRIAQLETQVQEDETIIATLRDMEMDATERADVLYEKRLPCREAEIAQKRYENAEAARDRFSAILDRGLTIMNDKQDIVGTLALRDAAIAYDARR